VENAKFSLWIFKGHYPTSADEMIISFLTLTVATAS
jgi:hypothetical protein